MWSGVWSLLWSPVRCVERNRAAVGEVSFWKRRAVASSGAAPIYGEGCPGIREEGCKVIKKKKGKGRDRD